MITRADDKSINSYCYGSIIIINRLFIFFIDFFVLKINYFIIFPADLSELVYVLGQDLERREVDLLDRLRTVKELRARLVDPEASETSFPCAACPQIGQHVRDIFISRFRCIKEPKILFCIIKTK